MPASSRRTDFIAILMLAVAAGVLYATSPRVGDFWNSDATRHAMDGAFYLDFFKLMPLAHARKFAIDYYLQYPALTILFYPPVFAVVEALSFSIFGVSHASAQLTVAIFYFAAGAGAYFFSTLWLGRATAFAAALLFMGFAEIAYWGRQVMLEIPAYAFVLWSAYHFVKFAKNGVPWHLYTAAALLVGGVYTKQTMIFMAAVFVVSLVWIKGAAVLRNRQLWLVAVLFSTALAPLAAVLVQFGGVNIGAVLGGQEAEISRLSADGWLYYARQLPAQIGWLVLFLTIGNLLLWLARRSPATSADKLMVAWLAVGYLFFSSIALKESRHTTVILFPLAFFAMRFITAVTPDKWTIIPALAVSVFIFMQTAFGQVVPSVHGYKDAADYVADIAPRDSVVLFSGYRDGSFIFNLRTREDRRDLAVLRADKLLLRVKVKREFGVVEKGVSDEELIGMLNRYGVTYIVNEPRFWDDLKAMQNFQRVLKSSHLQLVSKMAVRSNVRHSDHELEIYYNRDAVPNGNRALQLEIPMIGATVQGTVKGSSSE